MIECTVCRELTNKYKCPKCFAAYCSLNCYKQHKDSTECLTKLSDTNEKQVDPEAAEINEPTVHEPFKTEDTVPQEKLQQLGMDGHQIAQSTDLKNLLYNPHLRNLLTEIDTATNAWKAIKAAMHEPLFLEFADECLKIIEPSTNEENL